MAHTSSDRRLLRYEDEKMSATTSSLEKFNRMLQGLLELVFAAGLGEVYEHKLPKEATMEVVRNKTFTFEGVRSTTMDYALCLSKYGGLSVWAAADGRVYRETVTRSGRQATIFPKEKDIKLKASITWPAFFRMNCQYPLTSGTLALVQLDIIPSFRQSAKTHHIPGIENMVFPVAGEVIDALRQYPTVSRPTKVMTPQKSQPSSSVQPQAPLKHQIQAMPPENLVPPQFLGTLPEVNTHVQITQILEPVLKTRPGEMFLPGISDYEDVMYRSELKVELQASSGQQAHNVAVPGLSALTMDNHGLALPEGSAGSGFSVHSGENAILAEQTLSLPVRKSPSEASFVDSEDFYSAPALPHPDDSAGSDFALHSSENAIPIEQTLSLPVCESPSKASSVDSEDFYSAHAFKYHCDPHHCTTQRLAIVVGKKMMSYLPQIDEFQFDEIQYEDYLANRLLLGVCRDDRSGTLYQLWAYLKPTSRTDVAASIDYILGAPATEGVQRPPFLQIEEKKSVPFDEIQHNLYTNKAVLRPEFRDLFKNEAELQAMIKYAFVLGAEKLNRFMKDHHIPICETHFTEPLERVCKKFEFAWADKFPENLPLQVKKLRTTKNSAKTAANALENGSQGQGDPNALDVASVEEPSGNKEPKSKSKTKSKSKPKAKARHMSPPKAPLKEPMKKVKESRVTKSGASAANLNSSLLEALKESNRIRSQILMHADDREKANQRREQEYEGLLKSYDSLLTEANRDRRQAEDDSREAERSLDKMSAVMEQLFEQLGVQEAAEDTAEKDGDTDMDDSD